MNAQRSSFILVFLLFFSTAVFAQQAKGRVSGRVIDAETNLPVAHVSIGVAGSLAGTLSDSTGSFHLNFKGPATLYFHMLGYQSQTLPIDPSQKEPLTVRLVPKSNQLSEVVIHASPVEVVSKSKRYSVLDYSFVQEGILLIVYVDPRKAKLLLLSRDLDTLAIRGLPAEPNRLFKDCLGNVHVVGSDSLYQVSYSQHKLNLLLPKSIGDLENILLPCVAQDSSNVYVIEKYGSRLLDVGLGSMIKTGALTLSYTCIQKKSHARTRFVTIADEKKLEMSQDEDAHQAMKASLNMKGTCGDRLFAETVLYTEVYAPLILVGNRLFVFDLVNDRLRRFDHALALKQELPLSFHRDLHFQNDVQADIETQRIYAIFETNGITELKEISLNSGEAIASHKIPGPFATKVKVLGNYIYFIQKDKDGDGAYFLSRLVVD